MVAPEIAEAHELKALQRQEALAEEACRFTIADDGHGLCHGRFTLPSHVGAMLKQAVLAINSPRHRQHSGTPKGLGHAFCEYVTRYPVDRLPQAGGVDATVVVTMTLENLLGDSHTPALLDTGDPITADQARKLACEAGIIPMVLGGKSEILDLGRSSGSTTGPADRDRAPRPALHQPRLRLARRDVPRPPQHPLEPRRQHRHRRRTPPVPPAPHLRPQPQYEMKTIPNGRVVFSRT